MTFTTLYARSSNPNPTEQSFKPFDLTLVWLPSAPIPAFLTQNPLECISDPSPYLLCLRSNIIGLKKTAKDCFFSSAKSANPTHMRRRWSRRAEKTNISPPTVLIARIRTTLQNNPALIPTEINTEMMKAESTSMCITTISLTIHHQ